MSETLNYDEFYRLLRQAAHDAFTTFQEQHSEETFYAFGLFHEPLWAYIHPASNSEEGLLRCAQWYQLDKFNHGYAQMSLQELQNDLRWSSGDFEYLDSQSEHFKPLNDWLTAHNVYWLYADDWDEHEKMDMHLIDICRRVLQELDTEGVFIKNQPRERVVINIMMGDQDRSWVAHARLLNPPAVFERWFKEIGLDY